MSTDKSPAYPLKAQIVQLHQYFESIWLKPPGYQPAPPQYQATGAGQQANTTVILTAPPTTAVIYERRYGNGDHYLLLSIIISIWCCVCFSWWTLFCTIPAIFFAINAQDAEARGDYEGMQKNRQVALILDIVGVVWGGITFICIVVIIAVQQ